jgi:hypothetical protein
MSRKRNRKIRTEFLKIYKKPIEDGQTILKLPAGYYSKEDFDYILGCPYSSTNITIKKDKGDEETDISTIVKTEYLDKVFDEFTNFTLNAEYGESFKFPTDLTKEEVASIIAKYDNAHYFSSESMKLGNSLLRAFILQRDRIILNALIEDDKKDA